RGDVHTAAPPMTVTGTNGTTSTARMLDSLITAHDLRVGRFTSPHMHSVPERISVDGAPVAIPTFVRIYDEIAPYLDIIDAQLESEDRPKLTYVEALTVLRSEEHTSELQSRFDLVCRLLLQKKTTSPPHRAPA